MTIAHHWNSGEQTIPMRYGTAIEELIRRSSALETPPNLAHATNDRNSFSLSYVFGLYVFSPLSKSFMLVSLVSPLRVARADHLGKPLGELPQRW